ncbi:hypothetical protein FOZ61_003264 [Perkinsus olseni]|uniref:Uncharacterized protein n=1 Tax=Perkinsus olseni TaxID=32597 RepID=A0A7J6MIT3_PEROL|nr:hypothetical protein FOZ61_003264 [Perkinsus olseni]
MAELARGVQEGIDALLQTRGVQDEERDGSHRAVERRLMELEKLQKDTAIQVPHMPAFMREGFRVSALKSRAKKTDETVIEVERKWGARLDEHSKHIQEKLSSSVQRLRSPLYELVDTVRTKVEEVEHKTEGEARRVEADLTTLIQAEISKRSSELPCRPRVVSVITSLSSKSEVRMARSLQRALQRIEGAIESRSKKVDSQYDACKQDAVELRQEVEDLKEYVMQRCDAERVRSVEQLRESQQEHWRKVQKQLDGMRDRMERVTDAFGEERWRDRLESNVESMETFHWKEEALV